MMSSSSGGGGYTTESFTVKIDDEGIKLRTKLFRPAGGGGEQKEVVMVVVYRHITRIMQSSQEEVGLLASGLAKQGHRALTFDMRGIRRSTGEPSLTGSDEVRDVVAVCQWVTRNLSESSGILLLGCSAGAAIAGSALDHISQVVACVAVSYPFGFMSSYLLGRHYAAILQSRKPRLFIMAPQDWFTSTAQLTNKLSNATPPTSHHIITRAKGHCPIQSSDFVSDLLQHILHNTPTLLNNIIN